MRIPWKVFTYTYECKINGRNTCALNDMEVTKHDTLQIRARKSQKRIRFPVHWGGIAVQCLQIYNDCYSSISYWNTPTEGKDQLCLAQQKFRVGMDGHHPKLPLPSNYPQTQCLVQRQWRLKHVRGSCRRWNSLLQHEPRSSLDHPIVYQCLTNKEQQDKRSRHPHQVKGTVLANLDGSLYQTRRFHLYQPVLFNDSKICNSNSSTK